MSGTTPFDLSNATCYYRTRASRWKDVFSNIMIIIVATFISFNYSFGSSGTFIWMKPMLFGEVVATLGFVLLASGLPAFFYKGPSLAISKEGLYYEFNGGTLGLIPWDDIDYFMAGTASNWSTPTIKMYIKNKSALFDHVEEQLGVLPFLVRVQRTFKRSFIPFDIFATSFTTATRDSILAELKSALIQHREPKSENSN